MRTSHVAALGLIAFAALACGPTPDERQLPAAPSPLGTLPPPEPPPPPPPGAQRIELATPVRDELRNRPLPAGCPVEPYFDRDVAIPCRHFEVVAPGDGMLEVEVNWLPQPGAESVMLFVGGINYPIYPISCLNPQIGRRRVLAGATYGITVAYCSSHWDYIIEGPDLIGEFTLKATFAK